MEHRVASETKIWLPPRAVMKAGQPLAPKMREVRGTA